MARSNRRIHCPVLVRISYPPRERGDSWSSISLDPAVARLAEAVWGSQWKEEARQLAILLSDADPSHTSISRAVQAVIAEAAIERLQGRQPRSVVGRCR